jgi:CspA family cold shock protein
VLPATFERDGCPEPPALFALFLDLDILVGRKGRNEHAQERRRPIGGLTTDRRPEARMTGTIRTLRVDKGFGFIKDEAGKDYFFHQSAVYGEGLADLREGDSVEFDVGQGPKGPRAENVRRTST